MHMKKTPAAIPGVVVASVEGAAPDGRPLVRCGHIAEQVLPASTIWAERRHDWSSCKGLRAIIGFEDGDESKPVLLGLLDPPRDADTAEPAGGVKPRVLRIESEQELILECGKAKIALRADGRIVILGGYVLSRSKGVNKIKGGSVQIN